MRYWLLIFWCFRSVEMMAENLPVSHTRNGFEHTFQFTTGLVVNNWLWKFKDQEHKSTFVGWGGVNTDYYVQRIPHVKTNLGLCYEVNYGLKYKLLNLSTGLRIGSYPFRQNATIQVVTNDTIRGNYISQILLINNTIAPKLGLGVNFRFGKRVTFNPVLNIVYNMVRFDRVNKVIMYDSAGNERFRRQIYLYYEDVNVFTPERFELSLNNQITYKLNNGFNIVLSADIYKGVRYLRQMLDYNRINSKYVSFNLGIQYRL